jgi:hypothetical protein
VIKKFTYHQRLRFVLILGILFSIVLYQLAVSDTIDLMIENGNMEEQISTNQNAPEQIASIKNKLAKIDQLIGNQATEQLDVHQLLLESVTGYVQANNLILKDFPQPYSISDKGYITKTAVVTVEGDFIRLLKLSNYIETNYQAAKIVAIDFKATKELRTRTRKLNSTIYLQHVKTAENDENT